MIVVAIIALLAAITVPGFVRARKRSQAAKILNDLRLIDSAVDQYAIETAKKSGDPVGVTDWTNYLKENTTCSRRGRICSETTTGRRPWTSYRTSQRWRKPTWRPWRTTVSGRLTTRHAFKFVLESPVRNRRAFCFSLRPHRGVAPLFGHARDVAEIIEERPFAAGFLEEIGVEGKFAVGVENLDWVNGRAFGRGAAF
jgi:type II secretory pathway pseudopilin PulG